MTPSGTGQVYLDRAEEPAGHTAVVLGPFGMTANDMAPLSILLNDQGVDAVRVEMASSPRRGDLRGYRLSDDAEIIGTVLERFPGSIVVSISLAFVPLSMRLGLSMTGLVAVTPVVDLRGTLERVIGEDMFAYSDDWLTTGSVVVLGHEVEGTFVFDAVEHDLVDRKATLDRVLAAAPQNPVGVVSASHDPWVTAEEVSALLGALGVSSSGLGHNVIEAHVHELNRHPKSAMALMNACVEEIRRVAGLEGERVDVSFRDLLTRARDLRATSLELTGGRT